MPTLDPTEHDERILYWNKVYRTALLLLIILAVGLVSFVALKINENTQQTKELIIASQQSTIEARQSNVQRQDALKGYIKCLSLLRFDSPELLKADVTRQQVSDALDKCAVKE